MLPQDIIENEEEFLKWYNASITDKDRKEILVQYYLTNGDLPTSILFKWWRNAVKDETISKGQESGEFDVKIDNIYFKIHFCFLNDNQLHLDVVSTFTNVVNTSETGILLREKVRDLEEYKNVFSEDLIQELYNSIEYAVKKGHI
jgi:hypothetical protein